MADNVSYKLDTVKMDVLQRALQSDFPLQMAMWGGAQLEARGKRNVPPRVDTGAMEGSIFFWTQKGSGWASAHAGPTVEYGLYQEEGTARIKGHHYMRRALMELKTPFVQAIQAGLKRYA